MESQGASSQNTKKSFVITLIAIAFLTLIAGGTFYYHYSEKWRHTFHVTFLNIGQGDSTLIQFANGETMLVDCGPNAAVLAQLGKALPLYVHTIDYVLATHPDLDHYGGCVDVLRRYDVKHIIVNGRTKGDAYYRAWDTAMHQERGADVMVMKAPAQWTIGSSTLQFLSPDDSLPLDVAADDSNNYSIVFHLTADTGKTFLFTGDMEIPLEDALIARYCTSSVTFAFAAATPSSSPLEKGRSVTSPPYQGGVRGGSPEQCTALQSDVLKVGHHGSNSSSGEGFLARVSPHTAIVSVGKNKFGHPSLRVLKHLERSGAQILRTDEIGAIVER